MFRKTTDQQVVDRRPAQNLNDFAKRYELPVVVEPSGLRGRIGIDVGEPQPLAAHYQFDPSGDSYWVGAAERHVQDHERPTIQNKILSGPSIPGVTERLIGNNLVAMSMRDGLKGKSNIEQQRDFQDDVARLSTHYRLINNMLGRE